MYLGQSRNFGTKLREVIWAAATAIPGTDSLTLVVGLSGRTRKKGSLFWGLEDECVEDPSGLPSPSCPKNFELMEQLHSAHCFLPFSEGRTCSPALLLRKVMLNHTVVLAVSCSFMALILPLDKRAEIIYIPIANNSYKCCLYPRGLYPPCCSSIFTVLMKLE